MTELLLLLLVVVGWILFNRVLLPKMGVPT